MLLDSAIMSAMLLYIITNAVLFSFLMTSENIPQAMAGWIMDKGFGVVSFLLVVNVLLLVAGNVMEPSSIVLIMAPILFPVAMKLGIDPVHFGIMMVVNMEVGMCHPPVGLNLYVASGITKMGITRADCGGDAVAADDARLPGDRHLLSRRSRCGCPTCCTGNKPHVTGRMRQVACSAETSRRFRREAAVFFGLSRRSGRTATAPAR